MELSSQRLILRQITFEDADFLYALDNDPAVMEFITGGSPTPMQFIVEQVLPLFTRYDPHSPGIGYWMVTLRDSGEPLGWCCLRESEDSPDIGTMGYRFQKAHWRQGYATESATILLKYAFAVHGFASVRATTYEDNIGSRKTLEKLGFQEYRKYRVDLTDQPTAYFESTEPWPGWDIEYSLEKHDWVDG